MNIVIVSEQCEFSLCTFLSFILYCMYFFFHSVLLFVFIDDIPTQINFVTKEIKYFLSQHTWLDVARS